MEDTLAGFFTVIMIDEFNTSKLTTCCHKTAHAPKGRRCRGCTHCGKFKNGDNGARKTVWFDRDTGAGW